MARIRSIKPSFWSDEAVAGLSRDARLLAIGLISMADDEGRFLASTTAVSGYVFPHDNLPVSKVRHWLDEIHQAGIVRLYCVNRCEYGEFPNWSRHQKINRPTASLIPPPPTLRSVPLTEDSLSDSLRAQ